jgi:hypothetical protein
MFYVSFDPWWPLVTSLSIWTACKLIKYVEDFKTRIMSGNMCSYIVRLIHYTRLCFTYPIINVQAVDKNVHYPPCIKLCLTENVPGSQNDNKWKYDHKVNRNNMDTIISGTNWGATQMHLFGLGLRTIGRGLTISAGTLSPTTINFYNEQQTTMQLENWWHNTMCCNFSWLESRVR